MNHINFLLLISILTILISCGDSEKKVADCEYTQLNSLFYDMHQNFENFTITNSSSIITNEEGHNFSRLDSNHEFGFGYEFVYEAVKSNKNFKPTVSLKVNKEVLNSNFNVVFACNFTDESREDIWKGVLIDSSRIDTTNVWRDVYLSNEFELPSDIPSDSKISIYTWSADKKRVDIDDFKITW